MPSCISYIHLRNVQFEARTPQHRGCVHNINHNFKQSLVFYCQFKSSLMSLYLLYSQNVTTTNGRRIYKQIVKQK
jgi:hypothetical protein